LSKKIVTITGGNGFIGRILQSGLRKQGYQVVVFDRMKGFWVDLLRGRYLGTSTKRIPCALSSMLRNVMRFEESLLLKAGIIVPSKDDILDLRSRLVDRFRGSYAVIHLAALPHPNVPGATDSDFRRINYEGSVNVFEAAKEAGVSKFVFASSCQVYGINKPVRIDQFPILETNYCPTLAEGQSMYGLLKREFERYLEQECNQVTGIQAVSLRLEFPGVRSRFPRRGILLYKIFLILEKASSMICGSGRNVVLKYTPSSCLPNPEPGTKTTPSFSAARTNSRSFFHFGVSILMNA